MIKGDKETKMTTRAPDLRDLTWGGGARRWVADGLTVKKKLLLANYLACDSLGVKEVPTVLVRVE